MDLKELTFKAEDFQEYCIKNPGAPHAECIAARANQLLRERLEKAPKVNGAPNWGFTWNEYAARRANAKRDIEIERLKYESESSLRLAASESESRAKSQQLVKEMSEKLDAERKDFAKLMRQANDSVDRHREEIDLLKAKLKATGEALRRLDDGEVWNRGAAMAIVRAALEELRKP